MSKSANSGIATPASETFLFDSQRTGRLRHSFGSLAKPDLLWRFRLLSHPEFAPESCSVFDSDGHQYFGAHDGCFYSLDGEGKVLWSFKTSRKIYSSPTIWPEENKVWFGCGDGQLFCLQCDSGDLEWVRDLSVVPGISRWHKRAITVWNTFQYDYSWRQRLTMKCWASPLLLRDEGLILQSVRGIGLHALEAASGRTLWSYNLEFPWNHLAGPAVNAKGRIFIPSQRRYLHAVDLSGQRVWRFDTKRALDAWGNPSVDEEFGQVYFTQGSGRDRGRVLALDFDGNLRWQSRLPGATRGTAAISTKDFIVIACLNGRIVWFERETGEILHEIQAVNFSGSSLWTTPAFTYEGYALVSCVENDSEGSVRCYDSSANELWRIAGFGKSLSTPVIDFQNRLYFGSWSGDMRCYQT